MNILIPPCMFVCSSGSQHVVANQQDPATILYILYIYIYVTSKSESYPNWVWTASPAIQIHIWMTALCGLCNF